MCQHVTCLKALTLLKLSLTQDSRNSHRRCTPTAYNLSDSSVTKITSRISSGQGQRSLPCMLCGLSVSPGENRQSREVKLLPLLYNVHNRWILTSAALFVFRYCCLSNGAVLPLHILLFISLRLHPFDHTLRKLLPFVRGWFFTSISAFQRERLPLRAMTNPAEGRPLCARQTSTSCSWIELWWTNPHTYRSTSCWCPDECVVALGELVPGSNLSKTNDDTQTLANKAFTALSVLPNVSLHRCHF